MAPGRAVEVPGRLVGEQERRIVRERARDRDALLFSARQLRRVVMAAFREPDLLEERRRSGPGAAHPGNLHRNEHVLERRQRRQQVEELEDESDSPPAQPCERILVERRDVDAVDRNLSRRRGVEAGDEAEQRGLAAAGRPGDRHHLAGGHDEIQRVQDGECAAAARHGLRDAAQRDHEAEI